MTTTTAILASIGCGYLCGSIPFGYLAGKLKGLDIRQHGSGNIGATNAIRVLGKGIGIPVFICDMLKGWLPVFLAEGWITQTGAEAEMITTVKVLAGFAAVIGRDVERIVLSRAVRAHAERRIFRFADRTVVFS